MIYVPKHFTMQELVPPDVYKVMGDNSIILFDARILMTIDALRDALGVPITVNNWSRGGHLTQRGFRTVAETARFSQHMFGRAVDFDIEGVTAEQFRAKVRAGELQKELTFITRIEDATTWNHIDCADQVAAPIHFFRGW